MTALAPIAPRLAKLLPMLASDKDGEILAAVCALRRTLESAGCDLHDLTAAIAVQTLHRPSTPAGFQITDLIKALLACETLSVWERGFCNDVARSVYRSTGVSAKQADKLAEIYAQRIGGEA